MEVTLVCKYRNKHDFLSYLSRNGDNFNSKLMFENKTLVDLLRFDKVVQARRKDLSKGPVRRAGVQN